MNIVVQTLAILAEINQFALSKTAGEFFLRALSGNTEEQIIKALERCAKELKKFPSVSEILERIEDQHPGPEAAWSIAHKASDENYTVIWSEEIRQAYSTCRELLESDPVAARMTFKEEYTRLVRECRLKNYPVKWSVSLGHDKSMRESAVNEAVEKNRISIESAITLVPEIEYKPETKELIKQIGNMALLEKKEKENEQR